ncbi:class I SAM-dependent methyltransferase [Spirulina major]|uniref:class I SAM-dependent methyltransferase n=1 Tax=Spirulina major TaxID=270636 RepID=UPI0009338036|nr:class I SAM-dependent methyltransferase [Spirulina major]
MTYSCRHCGAPLIHEVIDLGHQPPSNAYLTAAQLLEPEMTYPLKVYLCTSCWLMQLPAHAAAAELFTADYAYFSSTSTSWCTHAERFVASATQRLGLGVHNRVVEIASNDGYLLQYVQQRGIPCLGIEPTRATAMAAKAKGIETLERFFGASLASELVASGSLVEGGADLVVANNVLAHVPDINDFMTGIARLLKPTGRAAIEFPHLLRLLAGNQFDTIYHEHYSYLSLRVAQRLATKAGLVVEDVEELPTHGGSLRVWFAIQGQAQSTVAVDAVLAAEEAAGLENPMAYTHFQQRAEEVKHDLLEFLLRVKKKGQRVLGYGAAAKGNTLLNYAGVKPDLLPVIYDAAKAKQNKFMPGNHIPILPSDQILIEKPDYVLILPWNIATEVRQQNALLESDGVQFVTAVPEISIL